MSTINSKNVQVGTSGTANQNFTLYQPASPDGTVRLGVGNTGATTLDAVTVTNAGNVTVAGTTALPAGSASAPALTTTGDTNTGVFFPAADTIAFSTAGTEDMRITSVGDVGIGTSSLSNGVRTVIQGSQTGGAPQTSGTTQTFGLLRLQGTSFTSVLDFGTNGGNYNWIQATDSSNLATNYSLALNPNGGNVGIGTSSPGERLSVNGNINLVGNGFLYSFNGGTSGQVRAGLQCDGTNQQIVFATATNERARIDSSGNWYMNSGYGSAAVAYGCRAWVNFNGSGTIAIRASGNVSSITDNGTGDYTVNFTTAMPDANYGFAGMGRQDGGNAAFMAPGTSTTASFRFQTYNEQSPPQARDFNPVAVAIFR